MPIAKTAFVWITAALLVIGFLSLVAIVSTSWWLVERSEDHFEDVIQARESRAAAVSVRRWLQDMERGQRGFLLTGDENYLAPYLEGTERIRPAYERLRVALAATGITAEGLDMLRETIEAKAAEMEETIRLTREGRDEEALEVVRTDIGRELMEQTRAILENVIAAADTRLSEGVVDQRGNTSALRWVTILGGIVILAVGGGAVWIALGYTRELLAARGELELLNSELEERVEERTEDLIRANEEIQRFAYVVTHDLRAPLVNIMGFTSELDETMKTVQTYVLADGEPLSQQEIHDARRAAEEDLPEAIGFIRASTKKMDGLINAILKISRDGRRRLKPERIELDGLLEATAATVHHQVAETDGEIVVDAHLPPIVGDRLSLEQIFGNLLDNAVKYRGERPIAIKIAAEPVPGGRVRVDVSDNGRGIAPHDHQRVFDLFRRAGGAQDQAGEGIGLAHVRSLVRNLGGDITLQSELGAGTTFTVILPSDIRTLSRRLNIEQ